MLFRREFARIDDVWQVVGLRGTGSDNYTIVDLFVDDAHSVTRESPAERRETGMLYRFQAMQLYASGFACVGLGTARAALDAFIALAKGKSQAWSTDRLRDNHAVQHIIGYADAALKAAKAGLLNVLDEAVGGGRTHRRTDGRKPCRGAAGVHLRHPYRAGCGASGVS